MGLEPVRVRNRGGAWLLRTSLAGAVVILLCASVPAIARADDSGVAEPEPLSPPPAGIAYGAGSWRWERPLPQGNDLLSVAFTDASHGWAVGEAGTILSTADSGAHWKAERSGVGYTLSAVAFTNATHGWAVGAYGTILSTTDGGAHWKAQTSGPGHTLSGVAFADAMHGWAVGAVGTILATVDGGAHWKAQASGTTTDLYSVSFVDAAHGWAVGDASDTRGTILAYSILRGPTTARTPRGLSGSP